MNVDRNSARNVASFPLDICLQEIKARMLNWAHQFSIYLLMDSNNYPSPYIGYEVLIGVGARHIVNADQEDGLRALQAFHDQRPDWLFGHLAYTLKNQLHPRLVDSYPVAMGYAPLQFFVPEHVLYITRGTKQLTIETWDAPEAVYSQLRDMAPLTDTPSPSIDVAFSSGVNKEEYIEKIHMLKEHILAGDCYEINYCNRNMAHNVDINPLATFNALSNLSPAPFAAFYRLGDQYLLCASPERYLKKEGSKIISQPIKGTAARGKDAEADAAIKNKLRNDIKEMAENIMIVDLVRNDLAITCIPGTVNVDELFGVYTFPQVHQLISTVSGVLKPDQPFTNAIQHSFPMGSMTGAPKHMVMKLIDYYEPANRELFSGSVGYITPNGDFDFNVIIRSLFYNETDRKLTYFTGGAITSDSVPENEWEEMRLKGWALEKIFRR